MQKEDTSRMCERAGRIGWIDTAKGAGMLLVLLGHILQVCGKGAAIRVWIYSVHMPLFFLLSGFLISDAALQRGMKTTLLKEAKALLLPYAVFTLLDVLLDHAFSLTGETLPTLLRRAFVLNGWNATWFLSSLFLAKVLCILLEKKTGAVAAGVLCLLGTVLSICFRTPSAFLGRSGCALVFVYAGRFLRRHEKMLRAVP